MTKTLLITAVLPWPLHRNGGGQRTALIADALRELGRDVDVLGVPPGVGAATPPPDQLAAANVVGLLPVEIDLPPRRGRAGPMNAIGSLAALRRLWAFRYAPRPQPIAWLDARLDDYDEIFVRYLQTALLCGLDERPADVRARCRIDLDDVDWLTLRSRFAAAPWTGIGGRLGMRQTLRLVRRRCRTAMKRFPARFVASAEDAEALAAEGVAAGVLPNVPFERFAPLPPSPAAAQTVLFVGDLQFPPNRSGLDRFLAATWPVLRREVPEARLRLVGRGLDEETRRRWGEVGGVEPVGFAEDLRAEYAGAAATVAPVWWGGGTKIKVVESAAMGRACVASVAATRGFGALVGKGVFVAADDAAMAGQLARLLLDAAARRAAEAAGPAVVSRFYSFDTVRRALAGA